LREKFPESSGTFPDDGDFLGSQVVTDLYREVFKKHNRAEQGSSKRFVRFTVLPELPQIDRNETTDKGYINQSAVLSSYAALVEQLYADPPPEGIGEIS
jgi:feruloyl-CoA synthase